jgi:hypothetical protein
MNHDDEELNFDNIKLNFDDEELNFDDKERSADNAYYDKLVEEDEMRPVPDLNDLVVEYMSSGMEPEDAFSMASATRDSVMAENERVRLKKNFERSMNKSSAYMNSATTQKLAEYKAAKRAAVEQTAKEKEDQKFIKEKMTDLEPFLMVLSRTDKALHDKIMDFILDPNANSLEDPDEKIRKELHKTRPGIPDKGKDIIKKYFMDKFEIDDDDYFGGTEGSTARKTGISLGGTIGGKKQHKSRKHRKSRIQRKSRKHRKSKKTTKK